MPELEQEFEKELDSYMEEWESTLLEKLQEGEAESKQYEKKDDADLVHRVLFAECQAVTPAQTPTDLPAQIGMVDGCRVLVVDAMKVMTTPDQEGDSPPHADFTQAANDLESTWVKREFGDKVFLADNRVDPPDWKFDLLHEAVERRHMAKGWEYEKAHEAANMVEMKYRREALVTSVTMALESTALKRVVYSTLKSEEPERFGRESFNPNQPRDDQGRWIELTHTSQIDLPEGVPTKGDADNLVWFFGDAPYGSYGDKTYKLRIPEDKILDLNDATNLAAYLKKGKSRSKSREQAYAESLGYLAVRRGSEVSMRPETALALKRRQSGKEV